MPKECPSEHGAANALTGPNRRKGTAWRLCTLFVIAPGRGGSRGILVVGQARALSMPFDSGAITISRRARAGDAVRDLGNESPKLVERAHTYLVFFQPRGHGISASSRCFAL